MQVMNVKPAGAAAAGGQLGAVAEVRSRVAPQVYGRQLTYVAEGAPGRPSA
jgi:hypothetical protein